MKIFSPTTNRGQDHVEFLFSGVTVTGYDHHQGCFVGCSVPTFKVEHRESDGLVSVSGGNLTKLFLSSTGYRFEEEYEMDEVED